MVPITSNTVTLVKGVGIIFMVLAHTLPAECLVWRVIYTFHMPLFFLMSGYCFKGKYINETKQFFIKKVNGIYVPFVMFSMSFLLLHNLFCSLYIYEPSAIYNWKDFLWHTTRIMTRMSHNEGLLGTFWFLKQLFWGNIIFFFTLKLCKKNSLLTASSLFLITELLCVTHIRMPYWGIDYNTTYAAFFISAGYMWRQSNFNINNRILFLVGTLLITIEILLLHNVSFLNNSPVSLLIYTLPAIFGTMMVYGLCIAILRHYSGRLLPIMLYVGQHTLPIMALHFISFKLVSYLYIKTKSLPITRLSEFPVLTDASYSLRIVYTLVGVIIPLLVVLLWNHSKQLYAQLISSHENK